MIKFNNSIFFGQFYGCRSRFKVKILIVTNPDHSANHKNVQTAQFSDINLTVGRNIEVKSEQKKSRLKGNDDVRRASKHAYMYS